MDNILSDVIQRRNAMGDRTAERTDHAPFKIEQAKLRAVHENIESALRVDARTVGKSERIDTSRFVQRERLQMFCEAMQVILAATAFIRGSLQEFRNRRGHGQPSGMLLTATFMGPLVTTDKSRRSPAATLGLCRNPKSRRKRTAVAQLTVNSRRLNPVCLTAAENGCCRRPGP